MPASLTIATSRPLASTPNASVMRSNSVWSLHTARRSAFTPACWSNSPVRRVSSQQISPTWASTSTARGDRSARLPMGVATSQSVLMARVALVRIGSAEFDLVARPGGPSVRTPRPRLRSPNSPATPAHRAGSGSCAWSSRRCRRRRGRRRRSGSACRSCGSTGIARSRVRRRVRLVRAARGGGPGGCPPLPPRPTRERR